MQDWVVERKLRIVPGMADISVLGGKTKEYQAEIDLDRMRSYGLTLPQIISAISTSNANVGGRTIAIGEQSVNVRGVGALGSIERHPQYRGDPAGRRAGAAVRHRARCRSASRRGSASPGATTRTDIIFGIVLMQKLERTMDVVTRVRAAVERINSDGSLPPGVRIEPFYDRGDLVAITVRTVLHNMLFGIALIFLIQWMFLGNLRCALIVSATIPVALFLAVIITVLRGEFGQPAVGRRDRPRHHRRRHRHHGGKYFPPSGAPRGTQPSDASARLTEKLHRILAAAVEVDKPIFFSVIITIAAFLPLFTMQGVEGQIFGPMSRTYAYALLGAVIATFTVTPVMSSVLLPERVTEVETFLVRGHSQRLRARSAVCAVQQCRLSAMIALVFLVLCGAPRHAARHRIPAEARRGQSLDPRPAAAHDHARGGHGYRRHACAT